MDTMDTIQKIEEIKRDATSIKIDPILWKEAKIEAIKHNITLSGLVEEAIKEWIKKRNEPNVPESDEGMKIASKYIKR